MTVITPWNLNTIIIMAAVKQIWLINNRFLYTCYTINNLNILKSKTRSRKSRSRKRFCSSYFCFISDMTLSTPCFSYFPYNRINTLDYISITPWKTIYYFKKCQARDPKRTHFMSTIKKTKDQICTFSKYPWVWNYNKICYF